jgi:pSer/pThr/pTyr-binding forkhead associated (FHA) protein
MTQKTQSEPEEDDGGFADTLRNSLSKLPADEATCDMARTHRDAIDLALDSRGDPFGRGDTIVLSGSGQSLEVPVSGLPVTIGSDRDKADYALEGRGISRLHARLVRDGALVRLEDCGSKNGTFLNGRAIESEHLCENDILKIGTVDLTVRRG